MSWYQDDVGRPPPPPGSPPAVHVAPGYPPYPPPAYPPRQGYNGMAIASTVLACHWLFGLGSILALVFGLVARRQIRERNEKGSPLATAGIVLGAVGIAASALFLPLLFLSHGSDSNDSGVETVRAPAVTLVAQGSIVPAWSPGDGV